MTSSKTLVQETLRDDHTGKGISKVKKTKDVFNASKDLDFEEKKQRLQLINKMVEKLFSEGNDEKDALPVFLWHLADIEPPVQHEEIKVFQALYRIHSSYHHCDIKSKEEALSILGLPGEEMYSSPDDLVKQAKRIYWQYHSNCSSNYVNLMAKSSELGRKKKAVFVLTNCNEQL